MQLNFILLSKCVFLLVNTYREKGHWRNAGKVFTKILQVTSKLKVNFLSDLPAPRMVPVQPISSVSRYTHIAPSPTSGNLLVCLATGVWCCQNTYTAPQLNVTHTKHNSSGKFLNAFGMYIAMLLLQQSSWVGHGQ